MQPWGQPHPQPQPQPQHNTTVAQHNTAWHNTQAAMMGAGAGWLPALVGAHNPSWAPPPMMVGHQPPPPMMGAPQQPPPMMGGATQPHPQANGLTPVPAPQPAAGSELYVVYCTGIGRLDDAVCRRLLELCGLVQAWHRAIDESTGVHKGFGVCEFCGAEPALRALRVLGELRVDGAPVVVKLSDAHALKVKDHLRRRAADRAACMATAAEDVRVRALVEQQVAEYEQRRLSVVMRGIAPSLALSTAGQQATKRRQPEGEERAAAGEAAAGKAESPRKKRATEAAGRQAPAEAASAA